MFNATDREWPRLSRRMAIRVLLFAGGIVSVAACAPAAPSPAAPAPAPIPAQPKPAAPAESPAAKAPAAAPPAAATQAAPKPQTLQKLEIRLNWVVIGYHAPFLVAVDKGYFADNGLDVKLLEGQGSGSVLQLIAAGQQPVGMIDTGVMTQGIQKGVDVRMVACLFQRNMYGIISPADAPLSKPDDLRGKKLAGTVGGAGEVQYPLLLRKNGIPEDAVTFVATDVSGKYAALLSRKVDGAVHEVPQDAINYESQNFKVSQLLYVDFGLVRLGTGLAVQNKLIKDSPNVVRGLLAGLAKGWQYAYERPAESVALSKKFFQTSLNDETLEKQWKSTFPFIRTDRTKDKPLFWSDKQDWEGTQNLLREVNFITETKPVETYFTNEFLPSS